MTNRTNSGPCLAVLLAFDMPASGSGAPGWPCSLVIPDFAQAPTWMPATPGSHRFRLKLPPSLGPPSTPPTPGVTTCTLLASSPSLPPDRPFSTAARVSPSRSRLGSFLPPRTTSLLPIFGHFEKLVCRGASHRRRKDPKENETPAPPSAAWDEGRLLLFGRVALAYHELEGTIVKSYLNFPSHYY
jgi:hypothetical protein